MTMSSLILGRMASAIRQYSLSARRWASLASPPPVSPYTRPFASTLRPGAAVDQHGDLVQTLNLHHGARVHL